MEPAKPLSGMALFIPLRRMGCADLTAHGFRRTSRDWCAEATNYSREVAEATLAHTLHGKTVAATEMGAAVAAPLRAASI